MTKQKKKKINPGLHQLIQNGQHNCDTSILHDAEFKIEALFCTCMRIAVNPFICACREFKNLYKTYVILYVDVKK